MTIRKRTERTGPIFGDWKIREFLGGPDEKTALFRLSQQGKVCTLKAVNIITRLGSFEKLSEEDRQAYFTARRELCRQAELEMQTMYGLKDGQQLHRYLEHSFVDWEDAESFGCDLLIRMEPSGITEQPRASEPRKLPGALVAAGARRVLRFLGWGLAALVAALMVLSLFAVQEDKPGEIHSYTLHVADVTWTEAFEWAREKGGYLARIDSQEEWEHILAQLDRLGYQDMTCMIGGRRELLGKDYHWVDEFNNLIGTPLNGDDHWASSLWLTGEPTYEYAVYSEYCLALRYKAGEGGWGLNDIPDDILYYAPAYSGKVLYIVEYED